MKILINHSPEDSKLWNEKERKNWDIIIDVPFLMLGSMVNTVSEYRDMIWKKYLKLNMDWERKKMLPSPIYLYLRGDPEYCHIQFIWWNTDLEFPITYKIVNEKGEFAEWHY